MREDLVRLEAESAEIRRVKLTPFPEMVSWMSRAA
jgi:hypothetical protein